MRRRYRIALTGGIVALSGVLIWWALLPGPPIPGDKRWCQAIRDKPIEAWTAQDARGYAEQNCMRWPLTAPGTNS